MLVVFASPNGTAATSEILRACDMSIFVVGGLLGALPTVMFKACFPQKYERNVPYKCLIKCPTGVFDKHLPRECLTRVSCKGVL